jgi:hypothetical protein
MNPILSRQPLARSRIESVRDDIARNGGTVTLSEQFARGAYFAQAVAVLVQEKALRRQRGDVLRLVDGR